MAIQCSGEPLLGKENLEQGSFLHELEMLRLGVVLSRSIQILLKDAVKIEVQNCLPLVWTKGELYVG